MNPHLLLAAAEACSPGLVVDLLHPDLDPAAALAHPPVRLPPAVRRRLADRDGLHRTAEAWLQRCADLGVQVLTPADAGYPRRLRRAPLRPLALFVRGACAVLDAPGVTVVGSRTPTPYGLAAVSDFATACARAGLVVWSGLAAGIDAGAHRAALAAGRPTVAVLAGGLDRTEPRAHEALAAEIVAAGGALSTEAPPGLRPQRGHFPRRNRILATAVGAVLVVEAGLRSGSLHTARFAVDAGSDVFAVPGPYTSPRSVGCHALVRDGAGLASSPAELLRALEVEPQGTWADAPAHGCGGDELALLQVLAAGPRPTDLVWRESGLDRPAFARAVAHLLAGGLVRRLPGGLLAGVSR